MRGALAVGVVDGVAAVRVVAAAQHAAALVELQHDLDGVRSCSGEADSPM